LEVDVARRKSTTESLKIDDSVQTEADEMAAPASGMDEPEAHVRELDHPGPAAIEPPPPKASAVLHLDEFCTRLSGEIRSPEAIGAFHAHEAQAGRWKDTHQKYLERYRQFLAQPTK
jgi:hypothetical protein